MRSFDLIGNREKAVAIFEIREGEDVKPKEVAEEIMERNKSVRSVLQKISERRGEYRTRKLRLVLGDKNTEVVHKEHGYLIKVDPQKAYFSPRESTERQRIAEMVKPKEDVLVMFAGVGPLAIAIEKRQPKVGSIVAVESNKAAVDYLKENVRINKLEKTKPVLGDVRKVINGKFNRILMPLPMTAVDFLDVASKAAKKNGVIHLYCVSDERDEFKDVLPKIADKLKELNRKYKIVRKQIVVPYAPRKNKVRIDIKVIN